MMKQFGLSQKTIDQIHSVFKKYPAVEKVIIYGSRAKGNYKTGSDIDLTLIGKYVSEKDWLKIRADLDELSTPYTIDLSIFSAIDNAELIDHIQHVGKVFFER